jgi:hypothetical protein
MFDIAQIKLLEDHQKANFYRAKVTSLDDPIKLNRIQINIFGLTDDIPVDVLPWCDLQFRDGVITYPNINDIIWLFFEGGDIFRPVYLGTIYMGLNAECDEGFKKFIKDRPIAPLNPELYKTTLKTINNLTKPDDRLIIQEAHQQFNNTILLEDDPFSVQLSGSNETQNSSYTNNETDPPITLKSKYDSIAVGYANNFPSTFERSPNKMYPWYYVEDVPEGGDWKSVVGGWTCYTTNQLQEGLLSFPDNLAFINYKRYKTWASMQIGAYAALDGIKPAGMSKRPPRWEFIPTSPQIYWNPEMVYFDNPSYVHTMSFPFGKMNLKSRKHYKQHTILSHDGKSAIELDDNENFERLRIDFNYSAGGLEFSRAGFNGAELWTDGVIKFHSEGRDVNGDVNSFIFHNADLRMQTNRRVILAGSAGVNLEAMGDAQLRSKMGVVNLVGGKGVVLGSMGGINDVITGEAGADDNGLFMAPPMLASGNKDGLLSSTQGFFPFISSAKEAVTYEDAAKWFKGLNAAMQGIKSLTDYILQGVSGSVLDGKLVQWAGTYQRELKDWWPSTVKFDFLKMAMAWEGIQIQGSRK